MAFFFLLGFFLVCAFAALSVAVSFKLFVYGSAFLKSNFLSFGLGFLALFLIFALNPILKNQNEVYRTKISEQNSRNYEQKSLEREISNRFWEQFGKENNNLIEMEKRGGHLKSKTFHILCDEVNGRCKEKEGWLKKIIDENCEIKKETIKSEYFIDTTFSAYCKPWINEEYFADVKQICQKVNKITLDSEPKCRTISKLPNEMTRRDRNLDEDCHNQLDNYYRKVAELKRDQERCQEFYKGKLILPKDFYTK